MAPNKEQNDETEKEFLELWKLVAKRKPHPTWQRALAFMLVEQSRLRERQERDAGPIFQVLLKDLQMPHTIATRIRETMARTDGGEQAQAPSGSHISAPGPRV